VQWNIKERGKRCVGSRGKREDVEQVLACACRARRWGELDRSKKGKAELPLIPISLTGREGLIREDFGNSLDTSLIRAGEIC